MLCVMNVFVFKIHNAICLRIHVPVNGGLQTLLMR